MSSQARKPYLSLKSSIAELFKAETRYLKKSNQVESVFEKPYLDYEYQTMHLKIPKPDWPTWYLPPWKLGKWKTFPPGGAKGGARPVPGCPGCALYADPTFDCVKDPVEIHAGIYCTNTPMAGTDRLVERKAVKSGDTVGYTRPGVAAGDTTLAVYAEIGAIKSVSIGAWAYIGPSAAVFVDPAIPEHRICGRMVDGAGSVCIACTDVKCCSCAAPPTAFVIVSYDSTIAPGGTAVVTVSGGCGPYTFSVGGALGYTVTSSGAIGTVTSASGVCGTDYAAAVTVTVTDVCGTSKTAIILNTGGQWNEICHVNVNKISSCSPCYTTGATQLIYTTLSATSRWRLNMASGDGNWCDQGLGNAEWTAYSGDCGGLTVPCGTPQECSGAHGGSCVQSSPPYTCGSCIPMLNGTTYPAATLQGWGCAP